MREGIDREKKTEIQTLKYGNLYSYIFFQFDQDSQIQVTKNQRIYLDYDQDSQLFRLFFKHLFKNKNTRKEIKNREKRGVSVHPKEFHSKFSLAPCPYVFLCLVVSCAYYLYYRPRVLFVSVWWTVRARSDFGHVDAAFV